MDGLRQLSLYPLAEAIRFSGLLNLWLMDNSDLPLPVYLEDLLKDILSKTGGKRFAFVQFECTLPILLALGS